MIFFLFFENKIRLFTAHPSYINYFPFKDLTDVDEICKDRRLKLHASRVMGAISSIVDNLDNPEQFRENIQKIIDSHVGREIGLERFVNLKMVLVQLLCDTLGAEIMDQNALGAWAKVYDYILESYKNGQSHS